MSAFPDARPKETLPCPRRSTLQRASAGREWHTQASGALSVCASSELPAVTSVIVSCDRTEVLVYGHASFIYMYAAWFLSTGEHQDPEHYPNALKRER